MKNQSDVARLLQQIQDEYEAGIQGLSGLAEGTAQHKFVTARMENMSRLHGQLNALVGPDAASELVSDTLKKL